MPEAAVTWVEASLRWYGVLFLLTWGMAPWIRLLCPRLADRGMLLARPIALLGMVYPSWLLASLGLLPYSTTGLWVTLAIAAIVGWLVGFRRGFVDRRMARALLIGELIAAVSFIAYVWLRGFTPEIINTEKPMDVAMLAASALTNVMPPPDPWFAGEPINYYYLGYLLHGSLTRMAGVVPTTGFNLALATVFSMTATAAVGAGFDAVRPWMSGRRAAVTGGLAAFLVVLAGNLYATLQVLRTPQTLTAGWWDKVTGIGWRASRIVCDGSRALNDCPSPAVETINEFPFFSFLLGDLHPHLMALPFTIVALGLALQLALRGASGKARWGDAVRMIVTGGLIGALYALNSWDLPTFFLLGLVAVWIGQRDVGGAALAMLLLALGAVVAWLPFILGFVPPTAGGPDLLPAVVRELPILPRLLTTIAVHSGERTSVGEYLTMFGVPYLFALWLIGSGFVAGRSRSESGLMVCPVEQTVPRIAIASGLLALVTAVLLAAPVLVLCGLPLVGALALLRREPGVTARGLAMALFAMGLALSVVVEVVYLQDLFGNRMNTLFKVYYQVWTLYALATAIAGAVIWREARPRWAARPTLAVVGMAAIVAGLVYAIVAGAQWTERFVAWEGLDGIAYVERLDPDEAAAIRWLQREATPGDVVLEATGCSYWPNSDIPSARVSAFTGMPTVLGWWGSHEALWRGGQEGGPAAIGRRRRDVPRLFEAPGGELRQEYGVTWLFLGSFERERKVGGCEGTGPYPGVEDADYPGAGWELAFESGETRVYGWSETVLDE